ADALPSPLHLMDNRRCRGATFRARPNKEEIHVATHILEPTRQTLHACFSRDLEPALTIDPGDTVIFRTLDAGWGRTGRERFGLDLPEFEPDPTHDTPGSHALCGPIAIRGAAPGDVLEVRIEDIQPDTWGWTWAGPRDGSSSGLGLEHEVLI